MAQLQGVETTKAVKGWVEFPKSGFQGLEVTLSPEARAVLQAQKHMAPQGWLQGENPMGAEADIRQVPHVWVQMASLK